VADATLNYYVLGDGNGSDGTLDGQGYYTFANWKASFSSDPDLALALSTIASTANFATGSVSGQAMVVSAVPEPSTIGLVVAAAGLASGVGIIFVIDTLDDRARSPEELQAELSLPLLATIGMMDDTDDMDARFLGETHLTANDRSVPTVRLSIGHDEKDPVTFLTGVEGIKPVLNTVSHRGATRGPRVGEPPLHGTERLVEGLEDIVDDAAVTVIAAKLTSRRTLVAVPVTETGNLHRTVKSIKRLSDSTHYPRCIPQPARHRA